MRVCFIPVEYGKWKSAPNMRGENGAEMDEMSTKSLSYLTLNQDRFVHKHQSSILVAVVRKVLFTLIDAIWNDDVIAAVYPVCIKLRRLRFSARKAPLTRTCAEIY